MSQKTFLVTVQAGSFVFLYILGMLLQLLALPRRYHETLTFQRSNQNGRHDFSKLHLLLILLRIYTQV